MSKDNKRIREELERIYGKKCMLHEGLKIKGFSKSKISYSGKSIRNQLTLHHLKPRHLGGKTTVENGAVLCRGCHDFLELATPETRERLNNLLREYKELRVEEVDDLDTGITLDFIELEITDKRVKARKLYDRRKVKDDTRKAKEDYERDSNT